MKGVLDYISVSLAVLCGWASLSAQAAPTSDAQLLHALETAINAKNKAAIMALYNWDGVPAWMKEHAGDDIEDWLTRELKTAKLAPLPAHFSSSGESATFRFHFNAQPMGVINLGFTDGFGVGFPYGKKDGVFCIPSVIVEGFPHPPSHSNDLVIYVQTLDHHPLPLTDVVCNHLDRPGAVPTLHFWKLYGGDSVTDGEGRFYWPATNTDCALLVAKKYGFGCLQGREITNQAVMIVKPWGHIEGVVKNRNKVVTNLQVELALDRDFYWVKETPLVRPDGRMVFTDKNGRFAFDAVPPLKLVINRHDHQNVFGTYLCPVSVKPGETNHLEFNGHGRTVAGHVIREPGLDPHLDLSSCSVNLISLAKDPESSHRTIYSQLSSNGTFAVDSVEPGDYRITGDLWGESGKVAVLDPVVVHVPDEPSDAADKPFDAGAVALKSAIQLKSGDMAPDFNVSNLDGKPLKLSDYRGKYVLLDFWATWCGPCVGEMPNMKATYDAYGKDDRFVIISLSLDSEPAAPKKFAQNRSIAWTQGFLGDWSKDKETQRYGVYAIPAIFLIGPDGKVLATGLRGTKIKETVASVLGK